MILGNANGFLLHNGFGLMSAVDSSGAPGVYPELVNSGLREMRVIPLMASASGYYSGDTWGQGSGYWTTYTVGETTSVPAGGSVRAVNGAIGYYVGTITNDYYRTEFSGGGVTPQKLGNFYYDYHNGGTANVPNTKTPKRSVSPGVSAHMLRPSSTYVEWIDSAIFNLPSGVLTGDEQWNLEYFSSLFTGKDKVTAKAFKNSAKFTASVSTPMTISASGAYRRMSGSIKISSFNPHNPYTGNEWAYPGYPSGSGITVASSSWSGLSASGYVDTLTPLTTVKPSAGFLFYGTSTANSFGSKRTGTEMSAGTTMQGVYMYGKANTASALQSGINWYSVYSSLNTMYAAQMVFRTNYYVSGVLK